MRGGQRRIPHPARRVRHRSFRPLLEGVERRVLLSNYLVTTTSDTPVPGLLTLRQAITQANSNPGPDTISFSFPASNIPGVIDYDSTFQTWRIHVGSALPTITDQVNIDGYSQRVLTGQQPQNAIQTISLIGQPIGGTFTLTFQGQTTAPIPFNANATQVQSALEALPNIGTGNVAVTLGPVDTGLVSVQFQRALGATDVGEISGNASGLITPGFTPSVAVSVIQRGVSGDITSDQNTLPVGFNAKVRVILDGSVAGARSSFTGLTIQSDHNIIRGLSIDGFSTGIAVQGPNAIGNLIQGNYIGNYVVFPNPILNAGTSAAEGIGNGVGVLIAAPTNNSVGGVVPETHNGIAGNALQGVVIAPGANGNQVVGNLIGVLQQDATLYYQLGNGAEGVLVQSSSNSIGGAVAGATNVISANESYGIHIVGPGALRNRVEANYIGTDPNGTFKFGQGFPGNGQNQLMSMGNLRDGIFIENAPNNQIGIPGGSYGIGNTGGNVISGNFGAGVRISGPSATGNIVQGDLIGVGLDGTSVLPNAQEGVFIDSANNTVGGSAPTASNTISGNRRGVLITGAGASGNVVLGNRIGTDAKGTYDLGNAQEGVRIDGAPGNTIGGVTEPARNLISGNNDGVAIVGATATGNVVLGNLIGTDATGKLDLGNSQQGVLIQGAPGNVIGGTTIGARNLISANHWGVTVSGPTAMNNLIQGNFIGTDITGTLPVGNEVDGVRFINFASNNLVGGLAAGAGNTIGFNIANGVYVQTGVGDSILSNNIFSNGGLGINLDPGANNNQAAPTLTSVATTASGTIVQGVLQSTPNTTFTVQFFANAVLDPSGSGEGQSFLGSIAVTTNGAGFATFTGSVPVALPAGQFVTSTATSTATGDTSEFSPGLAELLGTVQFSMAGYTVDEGAGVATIVVTRQGGSGGFFTINFATGTGTATPDVDYTPVSGTLTFNPGEDTKTFTVPIINDSVSEFDETVPLILSSPIGAATLGTPNVATLTILDNDQPGAVQFSMSNYTVNEADGLATITVVRTSGGGTVAVSFATSDGTATAGQDYLPVSGVLTFAPGVLSQTFTVPVLDDTLAEGNETVLLSLANVTGGASPGNPFAAVLTITNDNRDRRGPVVEDLRLLTNRRGITGVVLTFSEDLDPARAQDLRNYGYSFQGAGHARGFQASRKILAGLRSAVYDPATRSVTLTLVSPVHRDAFLQLSINQVTDTTAVPVGVADLAGNLLDGNFDGRPGGVYTALFSEGKTLSYLDPNGNHVTLELTGGGTMDLTLAPNGQARQLRLLGVNPGRSTLKGQVRRAHPGRGPLVVIPSIVGLDRVRNRLTTPPFLYGP